MPRPDNRTNEVAKTQMAAAAKFLFDTDFGGGAKPKPVIPLADHENKIKQAQAEGYRDGYAAAEAKGKADAERNAAAMLARVAAALDDLCGRLSTLEARIETEAAAVAVAVASKLAPALIAREPLTEVTSLVGECFRHLTAAPHLVIRVNDALFEEARGKLADIAAERGFEGRLVVLAASDIAPGDCRIEWADGGMVRDHAATAKAITELVDRYVGSRHDDAAAAAAARSLQA